MAKGNKQQFTWWQRFVLGLGLLAAGANLIPGVGAQQGRNRQKNQISANGRFERVEDPQLIAEVMETYKAQIGEQPWGTVWDKKPTADVYTQATNKPLLAREHITEAASKAEQQIGREGVISFARKQHARFQQEGGQELVEMYILKNVISVAAAKAKGAAIKELREIEREYGWVHNLIATGYSQHEQTAITLEIYNAIIRGVEQFEIAQADAKTIRESIEKYGLYTEIGYTIEILGAQSDPQKILHQLYILNAAAKIEKNLELRSVMLSAIDKYKSLYSKNYGLLLPEKMKFSKIHLDAVREGKQAFEESHFLHKMNSGEEEEALQSIGNVYDYLSIHGETLHDAASKRALLDIYENKKQQALEIPEALKLMQIVVNKIHSLGSKPMSAQAFSQLTSLSPQLHQFVAFIFDSLKKAKYQNVAFYDEIIPAAVLNAIAFGDVNLLRKVDSSEFKQKFKNWLEKYAQENSYTASKLFVVLAETLRRKKDLDSTYLQYVLAQIPEDEMPITLQSEAAKISWWNTLNSYVSWKVVAGLSAVPAFLLKTYIATGKMMESLHDIANKKLNKLSQREIQDFFHKSGEVNEARVKALVATMSAEIDTVFYNGNGPEEHSQMKKWAKVFSKGLELVTGRPAGNNQIYNARLSREYKQAEKCLAMALCATLEERKNELNFVARITTTVSDSIKKKPIIWGSLIEDQKVCEEKVKLYIETMALSDRKGTEEIHARIGTHVNAKDRDRVLNTIITELMKSLATLLNNQQKESKAYALIWTKEAIAMRSEEKNEKPAIHWIKDEHAPQDIADNFYTLFSGYGDVTSDAKLYVANIVLTEEEIKKIIKLEVSRQIHMAKAEFEKLNREKQKDESEDKSDVDTDTQNIQTLINAINEHIDNCDPAGRAKMIITEHASSQSAISQQTDEIFDLCFQVALAKNSHLSAYAGQNRDAIEENVRPEIQRVLDVYLNLHNRQSRQADIPKGKAKAKIRPQTNGNDNSGKEGAGSGATKPVVPEVGPEELAERAERDRKAQQAAKKEEQRRAEMRKPKGIAHVSGNSAATTAPVRHTPAAQADQPQKEEIEDKLAVISGLTAELLFLYKNRPADGHPSYTHYTSAIKMVVVSLSEVFNNLAKIENNLVTRIISLKQLKTLRNLIAHPKEGVVDNELMNAIHHFAEQCKSHDLQNICHIDNVKTKFKKLDNVIPKDYRDPFKNTAANQHQAAFNWEAEDFMLIESLVTEFKSTRSSLKKTASGELSKHLHRAHLLYQITLLVELLGTADDKTRIDYNNEIFSGINNLRLTRNKLMHHGIIKADELEKAEKTINSFYEKLKPFYEFIRFTQTTKAATGAAPTAKQITFYLDGEKVAGADAAGSKSSDTKTRRRNLS
jgi:hypothetical protein